MRKLNEVVQYDFQRNTFYKINKETGAESPTYKNGEIVKKFRPDVTGQHYLIRRKSERVEVPEFQLKLPKEKSFNTERLIPQYSYFKTLQTSRRDSKATQASILMRSTISKKKEQKTSQTERENSFLRTKYVEDEAPSKEKSEEKASKALLNQTLTSYTKLLKEKPRENHSPNRDQYDGSEPSKDPLDTLCTTLSHFRVRQPVWDTATPPLQKPEREQKPLECNPKEMASKQRTLFLDFHPQYRSIVKPTQLEVQVQRKRNLKILEDLFIRQGNRQTRRVYQSTT